MLSLERVFSESILNFELPVMEKCKTLKMQNIQAYHYSNFGPNLIESSFLLYLGKHFPAADTIVMGDDKGVWCTEVSVFEHFCSVYCKSQNDTDYLTAAGSSFMSSSVLD